MSVLNCKSVGNVVGLPFKEDLSVFSQYCNKLIGGVFLVVLLLFLFGFWFFYVYKYFSRLVSDRMCTVIH